MNLTRFLENRFQELTLENETYKDAFNVRVDSEIKATHQILESYRKLFKWALIPKVLLHFLWVKLGLKPEPKPVLINKLKKDQKSKKVAAQMLENVTPIKPVS